MVIDHLAILGIFSVLGVSRVAETKKSRAGSIQSQLHSCRPGSKLSLYTCVIPRAERAAWKSTVWLKGKPGCVVSLALAHIDPK